MQELAMTPSTVVLLVVIAALAVLAVRRLLIRGACDCNDHCGGSCHSMKSGCGCGAVEDMMKNMEAAARNERV